ncbi:hypothetical protein CBS147333_9648 [Penicillium roqueforti]|nr:hypothetical protein CBS147333_9648 [Penicillium roqueforti]KAI3190749.1 hypothetical protein CBS147311_9728 [Penicillium roqueforti]KAI3261818.1 hypothetical protein CBS147308_9606 [Penicillium roqueforti]KAI3279568.1 hypothetical protein DTO003C3_9680 [Penicillium roqueforti]KAI3288397.1 hypothetical protein DTO002I6_7345 [Penicillium roqueforti]
MADPPVGVPEAVPTNTQETTNLFSSTDFQPSITPRKRRQLRHGDELTSAPRTNPEFAGTGEHTGRVTTKEVRQLIDSLEDIIHHQTTLIQATQDELQELKHGQNAAVAASGNPTTPLPTHQRPDKDQNCVRISTQQSFVDPRDNVNSDGNTFGRYLSTDAANIHIRTALFNTPSTQDVQVAGIGTTKTGYMIRFKNPQSAETARNNTEWLNELGNNTKLAIKKIVEENEVTERGYQIEEVAWLKKKDKALGKFASLGIWFYSAKGVDWFLNNGLLIGQRSLRQPTAKAKKAYDCVDWCKIAEDVYR